MDLTVLKIEKIIANELVTFFPVVMQTETGNYLVDCGYDETFNELKLELAAAGIQMEDLTGVIITHDDIDHLGGLDLLKQNNQNLKIYCGEYEKDAVSGLIKSERLIQAESSFGHIPEKHKNWALNFIHQLKSIKRFEVEKTLADGEIFLDEMAVIHTPGHTKGHVSLFFLKENTLIAGDALVVENNTFNIANPAFTLDLAAAIISVEKIKNLHPNKIICYHGGIIETNIDQHLEALINKFKS